MEETILYIVTHIKGDSENIDDFKIIGIYSSKSEAEKVVNRLRNMPGFSGYPNHFNIGPYVLGKNYWEDGFVNG